MLYFGNVIKIEDFDFDILLDEKSCEKISIDDISNKILIGRKPLHIRFIKQIDLLEFMMELHIQYYLEVKYIISFITRLNIFQRQKVVLHMFFFSHNYAKIKVDPYDLLPLEKKKSFLVIIHINSVWNKYENHYFYNIFMQKYSFQLSKNNNRK